MSDQTNKAGHGIHENHWCEHPGCRKWEASAGRDRCRNKFIGGAHAFVEAVMLLRPLGWGKDILFLVYQRNLMLPHKHAHICI